MSNKNMILVGTGETSKRYWKDIKKYAEDPNMKIMAYSNTIELFMEHDIEPDYWFFVDPSSAMAALALIKSKFSKENRMNTTLLTVHHKDGIDPTRIATLNRYFAGDQLTKPLSYWHAFWDSLGEAKEHFREVRELKFTSIKSINQNPQDPKYNEIAPLGANSRIPSLRFNNCSNIIVFGNSGTPPSATVELQSLYLRGLVKPYVNKQKYGYMHMTENKLTMVALPVCASLGVKNLFIVGFDGQGGRWDDPSNCAGVVEDASLQGYYLREWTSWYPHTGMDIFSAAEGDYTILNQYIEHRPI